MILERNNFMNVKQIEEQLKQFNLENQIPDLKELINTYQRCHSGANEIGTKLENLDDEYSTDYDHNPIHHMEERLKSAASLFGKLERKGYEISIESVKKYIQDIAGIRVVTNYIDDIYTVEKALSKQSDVTVLKRKDYIANPKKSGYRSLHLVVSVPVFQSKGTFDVPVEIQLRTIGMDMWASLEHQLSYKTDADPQKIEKHSGHLRSYAGELNEIEIKMQDIFRDLQDK
ncbi:GTP pyrophosphokinase family protein [Lentilactobacillus hilgardii]|nr:GTP pyrophosphokinase family protein [Lentilactobacillus hilgardii]MCV3741340.1 GTP pyrophosphokinase family protein [Lentilactobacillus hilgardii]